MCGQVAMPATFEIADRILSDKDYYNEPSHSATVYLE